MSSSSSQVIRDYKPDEFGRGRRVRRTPWFIAGLGIPLLAVALIAPRSENAPDASSEITAAESVAQPLLATTAAPRPTADGAAARVTTAAVPEPAATLPGQLLEMAVKSGDSLDRLFKRHQLSRRDLANLMRLDTARKHLRLVKPGDIITVRHVDGDVLTLSKDISLRESLQINLAGDEFVSDFVERPIEKRQAQAAGQIDSSLFLAAAEAGISDRIIMNVAGIFAWDIDFVLDIREGDQFTLIYEELWRDGERIGDGEILAAEFVNRGEVFRALRYQDPSGRVDYYTPDGKSLRKAFVRAPLSFSRISSNFNPRRRHPKLNTIRAHRGVDYAAPTGTPVKAAGDGKIIHRGTRGGYGKTVIVQHGGNITTLYAHLSRYSKIRNGGRVRQGDVIGYVGATGLATGPHLHYEYRRNGVHLNPRTVKLPDAEPINPDYREEFLLAAEPLMLRLDQQQNLYAAQTAKTTP